MSEFNTSAELDVVVNNSSLRSARQEIEDELSGAASVNASASNQLRSDGGIGGGGGATDLLKSQRQTNDHFEDNLELNRTRNEILRDILDKTGGGGGGDLLGRLPGLGGLGGLLAGGGALIGLIGAALANVNWGRLIGGAIPDIGPEDIIAGGGAAIKATHLIAKKAVITAADVIAEPVSFGAETFFNAVVSSPVSLSAGQVLDHIVDPSGSGSGSSSGSGSGSGSGSMLDDIMSNVGDAALPAAAIGAGGALALADGPLPFGDAAGAALIGSQSGSIGVPGLAALGGITGGLGVAQASGGVPGLPSFEMGGPLPHGANTLPGQSEMTTPPNQQIAPGQSINGESITVNRNDNVTIDASSLDQLERDMERRDRQRREEIVRELERRLSQVI